MKCHIGLGHAIDGLRDAIDTPYQRVIIGLLERQIVRANREHLPDKPRNDATGDRPRGDAFVANRDAMGHITRV